MRGAEAVSSYVSLPLQEAFDIEYWLLEEAKLQRMPKEKPLSRKIALITGSAGGIGKGIAEKFLQEGACIVLSDINQERLNQTLVEFEKKYSKDNIFTFKLDVTDSDCIAQASQAIALQFGGLDIVVNNAGISISKSFEDHSDQDWERLNEIIVMGQFRISKLGVALMKQQGLGGDIVNIVI
jgi:NAD(P)-dependent dehydrogenase (short-subunit alcohol dehydrogenase family)